MRRNTAPDDRQMTPAQSQEQMVPHLYQGRNTYMQRVNQNCPQQQGFASAATYNLQSMNPGYRAQNMNPTFSQQNMNPTFSQQNMNPTFSQQNMNPGYSAQYFNPGYNAAQNMNPGYNAAQNMNPGYNAAQNMNPGYNAQNMNPGYNATSYNGVTYYTPEDGGACSNPGYGASDLNRRFNALHFNQGYSEPDQAQQSPFVTDPNFQYMTRPPPPPTLLNPAEAPPTVFNPAAPPFVYGAPSSQAESIARTTSQPPYEFTERSPTPSPKRPASPSPKRSPALRSQTQAQPGNNLATMKCPYCNETKSTSLMCEDLIMSCCDKGKSSKLCCRCVYLATASGHDKEDGHLVCGIPECNKVNRVSHEMHQRCGEIARQEEESSPLRD